MKRGMDHLRGALVLMSAGVIALAVAIFGLAFAPGGAQAQTPGATYNGTVDEITPAACGGGTIALTLDATGENIVQIVLDGTYVGGVLVNTVPEPDGPFVVDLAPPVAIAGDGTFDTTFDALPGLPADFSGTFVGDAVTGTFGVAALQCVGVTFSAQAGGTVPTPTATTEQPTAAATATVIATALPPTGTGAGSTGSDDGSMLWIALGIIGVVGIAGGALALKRRRA